MIVVPPDIAEIYPAATPAWREREIVMRAFSWCVAKGLVIPEFRVHWFHGQDGHQLGGVNRRAPQILKLRVDQGERQLLLSAIHELTHIADLAMDLDMPRAILEARADAVEQLARHELGIAWMDRSLDDQIAGAARAMGWR